MSLAYGLAYLVRFTPWDNDEVPLELSALVEGQRGLALGAVGIRQTAACRAPGDIIGA